jgi:hypothetical protein
MISTAFTFQYLPKFAPYSTTYKLLGFLSQSKTDCSFMCSDSMKFESAKVRNRVVFIANSAFDDFNLGNVAFKCDSLGKYKVYCDIDRPWDVIAVKCAYSESRRNSVPDASNQPRNDLGRLLESSSTYVNSPKLSFRKRSHSM